MNELDAVRARLIGTPNDQPVTTETGETIDPMTLVRNRLVGEAPNAPTPPAGPAKGTVPAQTIDDLQSSEADPGIAAIARRAAPGQPLWITAAKMEEARRAKGGNPIVGEQRLRMYDAYSKAYTGKPFDNRMSPEQLKQEAAKSNGFMENMSNAAIRTVAEAGAGVAGTVSPEFAKHLKQNIDEFYGAYDPNSVSGVAGETLGSLALLAPAVFNPVAAAGLLGASVLGGERVNIAEKRDQGQHISSAVEWTSAIVHGAAEFAFERVGLKGVGKVVSKMGLELAPGIFKAIVGGESSVIRPLIRGVLAAAGINAGQEALTQITQNAAKKLYSDTGLFEGVGRAAGEGALIGGGIAGVGGVASAEGKTGAKGEAPPAASTPGSNEVVATEITGGPALTPPSVIEQAKGGATGKQGEIPFGEPAPTGGQLELTSEYRKAQSGFTEGGPPEQKFSPESAPGPVPEPTLPRELQEGYVPPKDTPAVHSEAATHVSDEARRSIEESLTEEQRRMVAEHVAANTAATEKAQQDLTRGMFKPETEQAPAVEGEAANVVDKVREIHKNLAESGLVRKVGELVEPTSQDEIDAAKLAQVAGIKIGFVKDASIGGVRVGDVVLVRAGSAGDVVRNTVAHEVAHATGIDMKGLLDAKQLAKYRGRYREALARSVERGSLSEAALKQFDSDPAFQNREATATMIGDILSDKTTLARLRGENPGLVARIVDAVKRVIGRLTGTTQTTDRILEAFRQHIEENQSSIKEEDVLLFRPDPAEIVRQIPPEDANFSERLKTLLNQSVPKGSPRFEVTHWDKVKKAWKDDVWPFMKAAGEAVSRVEKQTGQKVAAGENPTLLLRALGGWDGTIEGRLKRGLRDSQGRLLKDGVSGKAITADWILEGLDSSSEKGMLDDLAAAMSLGVAERTIEKGAQLKQEDDISGFKKGRSEPTDVAAAKAYIAEYQKDGPAYTRAQEALRRYRLFGDQTLKFLVDTGWMTQADALNIRNDNQYYVNMQRVVETRTGESLDKSGVETMHRFRGSNRMIDHPFVNLLATTESLQRAAQHNKALSQFVQQAASTGSNDLAMRVADPTPNSIRVRVNGEVQHWEVDPAVKDTVDAYHKASPEFLALGSLPVIGALLPDSVARTGILNVPGKATRAGVTHAPAFMFRNAFRSAFERSIKSDVSSLWDTFNSMSEQDVADFNEFGASVGRREYGPKRRDYYDRMQGYAKELAGDPNTVMGIPGKAWEGWNKFGDAIENRDRIVEFTKQRNKAKQSGMSDYDANVFAAARSRDFVDFAVAGSAIKAVNRIMYIPFLNAAIQGLGSDIKAAKTAPGKVLTKTAMFSILPSLAAYAWAASRGKDELKEYTELPAWRRDFFWNFKVGDMYMSFPKPFTFGMVGSGVERAVSAAQGNKEDFAGYMKSFARAFVPVDDTVTVGPFKTLVENLSNYSFYFDRNIVPPWESGLALDLRNTSGSSSLGKWLSKGAQAAGWETDPRKWDNVLAGFGGTGQLAMAGSDVASGKAGSSLDLVRKASGVASLPPGYGSVPITKLIDATTRLGHEGSPEMKGIKDLIAQASKDSSLSERNLALSQARDQAEDLLSFYEPRQEALEAFYARRKGAEGAERRRYDAKAERVGELRKAWMSRAATSARREALSKNLDRIIHFGLDAR